MAVQQAPGLWRTDLQQHDLSVDGHEVVQARVDLGPEAPLIKHTHPGEEIIYVFEGSLEYQVDGQPTRTYNAGDALTVPAGVVHAVRTSAAPTPPSSPPMSSRKASRSSRWPSERLQCHEKREPMGRGPVSGQGVPRARCPNEPSMLVAIPSSTDHERGEPWVHLRLDRLARRALDRPPRRQGFRRWSSRRPG